MEMTLKNKKINMIGRATILGLMMVIVLMPVNVKGGVLMGLTTTSQQEEKEATNKTDKTIFVDVWDGFNKLIMLSAGVLMGD